MGWLEYLMLTVYGATCFNVGFALMLRRVLAAQQVEIKKHHDQAAVMLADATEKYKLATAKITAINEAVELWNYGAREEAIDTLKAAGVRVRTQ